MKRIGWCLLIGTVAVLATAAVASAQQPFSNIYQSPTVSPYLNLTNRQTTGTPNYQTLVRPAIEQQQQNIKQQLQLQKLQRQQKSLASAAHGDRGPRGVSMEIRGTGHRSTYMDYLHYYPQPQPR